MTKEELVEYLKKCSENTDIESAHQKADEAIIKFIDDKEIKDAYENVGKWYS